jgi:hydrogenase maturation protease
LFDRRVAVLGVGNVLCRDEGIGVHVIQALQSYALPPGVQAIDAGTAVLDVLLDTADCRKVIIVDAVDARGAPGTIYRLPIAECCLGSEEAATSLHEISLIGSLNLACLQIRQMPEVVIIGIEPLHVGIGTELSACLQDKLNTILATVLEEIHC